MKQKHLDWDFNALTPSDFELTLDMHTDSRMIKTLFTKARADLLRKKGMQVQGSIDVINAFDITPNYYPYLKITLKKIINKIARELKADKIEIIDYTVKSGKFIREKESEIWNIKIILGGIYADKR